MLAQQLVQLIDEFRQFFRIFLLLRPFPQLPPTFGLIRQHKSNSRPRPNYTRVSSIEKGKLRRAVCFDVPSHFRLGFAAAGDNFSKALDRFGAFVKSWSAKMKMVTA